MAASLFNDNATSQIYTDLHTLSLLYPLPILCLRRRPGELALRGLPAGRAGLPEEVFRPPQGRRQQAPFRTPETLRPRRHRPVLLVEGAVDDRKIGRAHV